MNDLYYKGYTGSIEASIEDECLHGKVLFIDDLITYEGDTVITIKKAFEESVDRYIAFCKSQNKAPNKAYSGAFQVRMSPDLHRQTVIAARKNGMKLNDFIIASVKAQMVTDRAMKVEHVHHHNHSIKITPAPQETMVASSASQPIWKPANATVN